MVVYYLRRWDDPELKERCQEVTDFSDLDRLVDSMRDTMYRYSGAGIAAPQVGDLRRVVIAKIEGIPKVFVNPEILSKFGYLPFVEGCLSFPMRYKARIRSYSIKVHYCDQKGEQQIETIRGLSAIILQHEMDHLEGKTIYSG